MNVTLSTGLLGAFAKVRPQAIIFLYQIRNFITQEPKIYQDNRLYTSSPNLRA